MTPTETVTDKLTNAVTKVTLESENGLEGIFEDKPMAVKISQVKTELKPMTAEESSKVTAHITNAVAMTDAAVETRKAMIKIDKRNRWTAFQGVGDIIKGAVKFVPGGANPMVEKLKILEQNIRQIQEKMNDNFAEMKSHITEVKFNINVVSPAGVLIKCMRDCLKHPSPEAVENFTDAYKENSPLKLAYHFISYLENRATNPLIMEMESNGVKTIDKFQKWERVFSRVIGQFLVLEDFAVGVFQLTSYYNCDVLLERSEQVFNSIEGWRSEYEVDDKYWAEVNGYLGDYMTKNSALSNAAKAKAIADKLDGYFTSDQFYVVVFNASKWHEDYTYICPNEKTQIIGSWNKGGCVAFIYRSIKANELFDVDYEKVKKQVMACKDKKIVNNGTLNGVIRQQLLNPKLVRGDGLVCLIDRSRRPCIEVSKSPDHKKGPGYYENIVMDVKVDGDDAAYANKILLVAFP